MLILTEPQRGNSGKRSATEAGLKKRKVFDRSTNGLARRGKTNQGGDGCLGTKVGGGK